jgi:hypothetical protein
MKVSHLWLNVKDNSVYGMASVLGFKFDDLMLMFQALGLINAGLSLIKPELWAGKLGVDVLCGIPSVDANGAGFRTRLIAMISFGLVLQIKVARCHYKSLF